MRRFLVVLGCIGILFFSSISSIFAYSTGMSASVVLGQPDFTGTASNQGIGSATGSTLSTTNAGVYTDGTKLIICDFNNNRVLIWNHMPTVNGTPADMVLGQPDLNSNTANNGGRSELTMSTPNGIAFDGNKLAVVDRGNNRVLIWNTFPTRNQQPADVVVGQSLFSTAGTGTNGASFNTPTGVAIVNNKLLVADLLNHRVLIWNSIPTTNGATADLVIGQTGVAVAGGANQGGSTRANTLSLPRDVASDGTRVFTAESGNNRVLIFNSVPTTNNASADVVVGQNSFSGSTANQGLGATSPNIYTENQPNGVKAVNNKLIITDTNNSRILIYNTIPTTNGAPADLVIGQVDFNTVTLVAGAAGSNGPRGATIGGGKLIMLDSGSSRALIYNDSTVTPQITLNTPLATLPGAKLRASGNVVLGSRGTYSLQTLKVSINGVNFADVTNLGSGTDSGLNTSYDFFSDIDPATNDMGANSTNYTLKFLATSSNGDVNYLLYFLPFKFSSFNLSNTNSQSFTFSVNKDQLQRIKDNLDHFEIYYKKNTTTGVWTKYVDNISKTQIDDNGVVVAIKTNGTKFIGSYIFKVVASDNWNNKQDSNLLYTAGAGPGKKVLSTFSSSFTPIPSSTPKAVIETTLPSIIPEITSIDTSDSSVNNEQNRAYIVIAAIILGAGVLVFYFKRRRKII